MICLVFFFLARLKISVGSRNYNLCVESMPETDFGMPGMTQITARPASRRIWHAGHARKFGMPGMPEILVGMNYLLLEPRPLAGWVRRSRNLKLCLQGMRNSVACQFQCKTTLGPPPLLPVSKSLTIGMGKILACQPTLKTSQKCPQLLSHALGEALKYRIS